MGNRTEKNKKVRESTHEVQHSIRIIPERTKKIKGRKLSKK